MWLRCTLADGAFADELSVVVRTAEGRALSLYVPRWTARLPEVIAPGAAEFPGQIPVDVLQRDDRFGLIALPAAACEGPRVAQVEARLLSR